MFVFACRAYTDFVINMSTQDLATMDIQPGSDVYWPRDKQLAFIEKHNHQGTFISGGPLPNSLAHVAQLGGETALIAKLANDKIGTFTLKDFKARNIAFHNALAKNGVSPLTIVITDETGERTILYNRGVADDLTSEDITLNATDLQQAHVFMYSNLLRSPERQHLWKKIHQQLPKTCLLATTLQSFNASSPATEASFILANAQIIFGNEEEYAAFLTHTQTPTLPELAAQYPNHIFVRTLGQRGAEALNGKNSTHITPKPTKIKDATGAGDALAGGFLYAYATGQNFENALKLGMTRAQKILQITGGRPTQ